MAEKQKKLMLLGGLRYLLPVIEEAHKLRIHVITVDYIPDNIAHKYSDEYHNVSILDKEAILNLAEKLEIDGIMSFAVDPGVVTAAYVAEKMGLPFQGSFESVKILQDKARFRKFLTENGFNVPNAKGYDNIEDAMKDTGFFNWPVIVKPVDSAGSKGVSRVENPEGLEKAIKYALSESHSGNFIIEDFLEKEGQSSDTDSFTIEGKLVYCSFSDQRFDDNADNPFTPSAYSWPSTMPEETQKELISELQRLMSLLNMKTGIYNIETRLCKNGKPYIMEVSPRGGGNRLAEMLKYASRTALIANTVKAAVGMPVEDMEMPKYYGHLAEVILHADNDGRFERIDISEDKKDMVVETDLWVKPGDEVHGFSGANNAIGTLVVRFPDSETLESAMSNIPQWCKVIIK
ncbi:MAG: ATP-grasp domain-containing protein [Muribaculaceae bacterium]|nr:ATP-grasp domain-containing protein [Muribaculaceae bacterium]